ncbi:MAG: ribosome assembly factor SBDS [Thermoplasmata archaeon]|nr:ribosome assembly factor SBDS [Thermoplasmata archaeon]
MTVLEKYVVARLEKGGKKFEILVDPQAVEDFLAGKEVDLAEAMATLEVWRDVRKAEKANRDDLIEVFGTDDPIEIAKVIIREGRIQLTTEQRRKRLEEKMKKIADIISRYSINPQTGAPHPPQRILKAMEEASVHIDLFKDAEAQVQDVLKAIQSILPIRYEVVKMAIKCPPEYYGKIYGDLKRYGKIAKEEWGADGFWYAVVEVPAGLQVEFLDMINKRGRGNVQAVIMR